MQKLAEAKQDTKINKPEVTEPIVDISNLLLTDINKIISEFPNGKLTKNTDIKTSNYMYVSPQYSLVFEYQSNETIKNNEAEIDGYNNSLQYLYNFPEKITHVQATLENETCEYHKNIDIKPKAKDFLKKVGFVEPKLIDEFQSPLNKKEVSYEFAEKNATLIIFCSTNLENKPVVRINYSVKLP